MATTTAPPPGTMDTLHLALHLRLHGDDHLLGQERIGATRLGRGDSAGENADADQEALLVRDDAGAVETLLQIAGSRQFAAHQRLQAFARGQ